MEEINRRREVTAGCFDASSSLPSFPNVHTPYLVLRPYFVHASLTPQGNCGRLWKEQEEEAEQCPVYAT